MNKGVPPETREEIIRLRRAGAKYDEIERRTGLSDVTVWKVLHKAGCTAQSALPLDLVDRIIEMGESGASCPEISAKLGVTASAAHYHCVRAGVIPPARQVRSASFSQEDDARLVELQMSGMSIYQIAKIMRRSYTSCVYRAQRLAAIEEAA